MSFEKQIDLVKAELELTQRQMDKYDSLSGQIKTWTITLSAALIGWSFQTKNKEVVLMVIFVVLAFWALDAFNKNFRQDYKKRRDDVAAALRQYFKTETWPNNFVSPSLPKHHSSDAFKKIFQPHIFLLYLPLIAIALLIYFI